MHTTAPRPWTTSLPGSDELQALISAAAETVAPARLPAPSRRSHVALYPVDGSRRGLSMLAPKVRLRWLVPALAIWMLGAAALLLANHASTEASIPRELRGTWVADGANGKALAVTLGERSITFQNSSSPTDVTTHAITGVRWSESEAGVEFTVEYLNGLTSALHGRFTFLYWGGGHPDLVVPGEDGVVWWRAAPPGR